MPKLSKDFPAQLSVQVTEDTRIQLIAIGYLSGNGGEYGPPVRNLLHRAILAYVDNLDPRMRKEYEEILANVRIQETKRLPTKENQKAP